MSGNSVVTSWEPGLFLCGFVPVGGLFVLLPPCSPEKGDKRWAFWSSRLRITLCLCQTALLPHREHSALPKLFYLQIGKRHPSRRYTGRSLSRHYGIMMVRERKPSSSPYTHLVLACSRLSPQPWSWFDSLSSEAGLYGTGLYVTPALQVPL